MIDELGPEARALLAAARDGLSPDPAAVRRVHARIASATGGAAAGTAIAIKLGVIVLAAAVAAGIAVYATRDTAGGPGVERAVSSELPARRVVPAISPASTDEDLITIEPAEPTAAGAPGPARSAVPARAPMPHAGARPAPGEPPTAARAPAPTRGIDLAREVELVDLAMAALRRGDAAAALDAVRRHAAETAGRGQLAEDAAAIEVEALCRLHDPATRARLEAFDARFPRSAQRSRLTSKCP